jgi:hypothetical protein
MMDELTADGRRLLEDIAVRNGVSMDAVTALFRALALGNGTQAQFNHPDLGGMGQWSNGGMIMVGDMFNQGLKARVDSLCKELAGLLRDPTFKVRSPSSSQSQSQGSGEVSLFVSGSRSPNQWWPADLGSPASTGSQNDLRYAWFSGSRRLAIQRHGQVQVYDTADHTISGFSQQQSEDQSLTFTSQHGLVRVSELRQVEVPEHQSAPHQSEAQGSPQPDALEFIRSSPPQRPADTPPLASPAPSATAPRGTDEIFGKIERLADLHQKGILTAEEFAAKKAELLARI